MGRIHEARRRREALQQLTGRHKNGRFWYPVLDERVFSRGDVIWIDRGPSVGRHEVKVLGHRELLVHPIGKWEELARRWRGRLRRWWIRLWRGR
jgi:hypothetical protein